MHDMIIEIDDLPSPYSDLTCVLTLDEIVKLANKINGLRIYFKRSDYEDMKIFDIISECIGRSKAVDVCKVFSGENIYFTSLNDIRRTKIQDLIKAEFTGYNVMELAIKYNYSENHIRNIIGYGKPKPKHSCIDGQIMLSEIM
jgi:Mor family transcriptional regulator